MKFWMPFKQAASFIECRNICIGPFYLIENRIINTNDHLAHACCCQIIHFSSGDTCLWAKLSLRWASVRWTWQNWSQRDIAIRVCAASANSYHESKHEGDESSTRKTNLNFKGSISGCKLLGVKKIGFQFFFDFFAWAFEEISWDKKSELRRIKSNFLQIN